MGVLHDLETTLGGKVRKKTTHLSGNILLTRQLRTPYRGHKVEVLANDSLILADVEASYGQFELLVINPRWTGGYQYGKPAYTIHTTCATNVVVSIDGNLTRPQSELFESGTLQLLLDVIGPHEGEEVNVSQRLVRVYLQRPTVDRVMAILDAVIDLMPHDKPAPAEFGNFPDVLRPLVPFLGKWAIEDDEERSRKLKRCSQHTRQKLVDAVVPLLPAIDNFLDSFGANPPEEVCAWGSLAQAALEAQSLLRGADDNSR